MNNSSIFDNYVFLTICEITYETFKDSGFSTHANYCRTLGSSLNDNVLLKKEKRTILAIMDELEALFSMTHEESSMYIVRYFNEGQYNNFETSVRLTKECFPLSVIVNGDILA